MIKNFNSWILILNSIFFSTVLSLNEPISHEYCIVGAGAAGIKKEDFN
jgi:hypothetical protein